MVIQMRLTNVTPLSFAQSNRHLFITLYHCLYLGLHPRPRAEGRYKNSKVLRNLYGYFIRRQPSQPFGVWRAPSEPASAASVVKKFTVQKPSPIRCDYQQFYPCHFIQSIVRFLPFLMPTLYQKHLIPSTLPQNSGTKAHLK